MSLQEYIATGSPVADLLAAADEMPDVTVTKIGSRYVVIETSEKGAATLRERLAGKFQIAPNKELRLYE